jgi:hypothetical protein
MCVPVIRSAAVGEGATERDPATGKPIEHKMRLRHRIEALKLESSRVCLHVVEAVNTANTARPRPRQPCRPDRPRRARTV